MNLKLLLLSVLVVGLLLGAWWYESADSDGGETKSELGVIKVGHAPGQFSVAFPIFLGEKTGIFAKHELKAESVEVDTRVGVPALLGGSVDYIAFSREGAAAALKGGDVKFVMMLTENQFQQLIGRPGAISTALSIGVSHLHGATHFLTLLAIERGGYEARLVDAGNSFPATIAMLKRGEVDAAVLGYFGPTNFAEDGIDILDDFGSDGLITGLSTLGKTTSGNPAKAKRVIAAFQDIAAYIKDNPEETREILYEYYGFTERKESENRKVEAAYEAANLYFSATGQPSLTQQRLLVQTAKVSEFDSLDEIRQAEVSKEDLSTVFDLSLVE